MRVPATMATAAVRIAQRVRREGDCLVYTGGHDGKGYGRIFVDGRRVRTHRLAWELAHGPIPDGLYVMHACDNPPCCSLDHLSLGTHADNMADAKSKGRFWSRGHVRPERTVCKRGHRVEGENRYAIGKYSGCRQCRRDTSYEHWARKRSEQTGPKRGPCPECGKEINLTGLSRHRQAIHAPGAAA